MRHFLEGKEKDWRRFYKAACTVTSNEPVAYLAREIYWGCIAKVWIVSGRSDEVEEETRDWLALHQIPFDELVMRKAGDYTPDDELKMSWLDSKRVPEEEIRCVFDDRDRVVAAWRKRGIACFQVKEGAF